jgi:23S rRNA pseudouridine955/2504/2580 synthase
MNQGVSYQKISPEEAGQRIDNYLIKILKGVPKSHIYRIIRSGEVRINKKRAQPQDKLLAGDSIRIPPVKTSATKEVIVSQQLENYLKDQILYEDDGFLVLNKPAGLAVHGGSGLSLGVIEALRKMRPKSAYLELVHRLDKETSGCLLIAKKRSVLRAIQALLVSRQVTKIYWTLLEGHWEHRASYPVELALRKNTLASGERVVCVHPEGKPAYTDFRLLENFKTFCLVEARPKTGRTHQIRVHAAAIKHPILGDEKYNQFKNDRGGVQLPSRLYLHAREIRFTLNGVKHAFVAALDQKFTEALTGSDYGTTL